ncbi:MAG: hypothetical protein IJW62_06255 [Clostridia bacterium]|nr:hypothetical protein [Clostridia bacterium]
MFEQILQLIRDYPRIIIHRHKNPDGDALGSQLGLYHMIRDSFPEKEVYTVGDLTPRYAFMLTVPWTRSRIPSTRVRWPSCWTPPPNR